MSANTPRLTIPLDVARFLNNAEAAAFLRLSPRTLEKRRMLGDGVVFRRRLHVSLEVGCTNNAACEDGAKNHVAISQNVLPPPQVTLPRPLCAALHRLQHEQLSHRLPSSNKPGLTIFHQHFGNQRARVVVR